jgi:hypothetical protein
MKLFSLVSIVLLFCCVSPLLAREGDDADHVPIKIDPLPAGWNGSLNDDADTFFAMNDDLVMVQINSSYHDKDFKAFCEVYMEREAGGLSLKDRKSTDPQPASVGPKGTLEYDITGMDPDSKAHSHVHIYMMPIRKTWGFMSCRCTEDQWEKYKKVFVELLKNAK